MIATTRLTSRVPAVTATIVLGLFGALAAPVQAAPAGGVIVLPGATSAEGIAAGAGTTFYAGDLVAGDIFRGDLRRGPVVKFIDVAPGRMAVGLKADVSRKLLFVAGGSTGQGYVYDTTTGETRATYQFTAAGFINDVALTREGAWFTDSANPVLYFVPVTRSGEPGPSTTLTLTGPAADTSGDFNNNGIAATPNGKTLLVAHSGQGAINRVDPRTGTSAAVTGVSVPSVDGILLDGGRLYAVQNSLNQVAVVDLAADLGSGVVEKTLTSKKFQVPTTVARFGAQLALPNAKFDTGFPPTASQYEVVVIDR